MTFTAVGTQQTSEPTPSGSTATFSLTTTTAGDWVLLETVCNTRIASGVSGGLGGGTWTKLTSDVTFTTSLGAGSGGNVWAGKVTSAGTATVTVTFPGTPGTVRFASREFSVTSGNIALDVQGSIDSGGTSSWASLTPSGGGRLYWGYAKDNATAVAGSTPGFVYEIDSFSNGEGYNLSVSSAFQPVWGDSTQAAGVMVLVAEVASGGWRGPQPQPGTRAWRQRFRRSQVLPKPNPAVQAVNVTGGFTFAALTFSGTASQTSPDVPQVTPGPVWLRLFRPSVNKPVPVPPAVQNVTGTAGFTLAPLLFTAQGSQTSPDTPQIQPGVVWLDLFKPWLLKPRPVPPALQGVTGTASFTLAPVLFSAQGAATSPDLPQVTPGPVWLRLFKPWTQKPAPWLTSAPFIGVSGSGSFSLAPFGFTAQGSVTAFDLPQINPGATWLGLFRRVPLKPHPVPSATQAVTVSGAFLLAPLTFQAQGTQSSADVSQVAPGVFWLRLFKPWVTRPAPPIPAVPTVSGTASFTLAPVIFSAAGNVTGGAPGNQLQVIPGPAWLRWFRHRQYPVPPQQALGVTTAGSFTVAPLMFTGHSPQDAPVFRLGIPYTRWVAGSPRVNWRIP